MLCVHCGTPSGQSHGRSAGKQCTDASRPDAAQHCPGVRGGSTGPAWSALEPCAVRRLRSGKAAVTLPQPACVGSTHPAASPLRPSSGRTRRGTFRVCAGAALRRPGGRWSPPSAGGRAPEVRCVHVAVAGLRPQYPPSSVAPAPVLRPDATRHLPSVRGGSTAPARRTLEPSISRRKGLRSWSCPGCGGGLSPAVPTPAALACRSCGRSRCRTVPACTGGSTRPCRSALEPSISLRKGPRTSPRPGCGSGFCRQCAPSSVAPAPASRSDAAPLCASARGASTASP